MNRRVHGVLGIGRHQHEHLVAGLERGAAPGNDQAAVPHHGDNGRLRGKVHPPAMSAAGRRRALGERDLDEAGVSPSLKWMIRTNEPTESASSTRAARKWGVDTATSTPQLWLNSQWFFGWLTRR